MTYIIQEQLRSKVNVWRDVTEVNDVADAIHECRLNSKGWLAGQAIHRVIEKKTGVCIYERGWIA